MFGNSHQINFSKIGQRNDREFLFDVPREDRFKTPKRTVVAMHRLSVPLRNLPCESVGMRLPALEDNRSKDLRPAFRLQERARAYASLPGQKIVKREKETSVRRLIECGRYPLLGQNPTVTHAIARDAIRNNVRVGRNTRRLHAKWFKNMLVNVIPVELSCYHTDDDAK